MADNDTPDRFLLLVLRYFDGDLDVSELAELSDKLRTNEDCRRRFAEFCTVGTLVREIFEPERQAELRRETRPAKPVRPRRWRVALAAAAILAVMPLGWWLLRPPTVRVVGSLQHVSGDVRIFAAGGEVSSADAGAVVRSGDTVRVHGKQAEAVFVFGDGSSLTLNGDTAITLSGGQRNAVVHHGNLAVHAKTQPSDQALTLATPTAHLEVLGTQFLLEARPEQTDVSVIEGRMRVTRVEDSKSVDVNEGQRLLTRDRAELVVQDISKPAEEWGFDFEDGLPKEMTRGRFVNEGLPAGSKGGVAAIRADHGKHGFLHEIATPENWSRGLFALHDDSHLHFTYKMGRPDWLNVFIIVREPNGPFAGNYLFNKPVFRRPAGRWQTITIPLSEFKKAGSEKGESLRTDLVPFLVLLSSDKDRGLVIDRIWVTRGGPGAVEFKSVD